MASYYFLTSLFPSIEIGHTPSLHFEELAALMADRLENKDYAKFSLMRYLVDLENLRAYLQGQELDPLGNLSEVWQIEQSLRFATHFDQEVFDFLAQYHKLEDRLRHFSKLFALFFQCQVRIQEGFLQQYFRFEREMRLCLLGFRAKKRKSNLLEELQYEDPHDRFVAQMLAQKDAAHFEPPFEYEDLKHIYRSKSDDPFAFHKALCEYRFQKIRDLETGLFFSIDKVLGFVARLMIVESWLKMDAKRGLSIVETMSVRMKK